MMRIFSDFASRVIRRLNAFLSVSSHEPTKGAKSIAKAGEDLDGLAGLFSDIRREWDTAEEVIKVAEQVTADVVIPAIMELRYAGRRLVDALNAHANGCSGDEICALVEDARFDCHRARHDAIDAALTQMAIDTDNLARQVGYDVVHNSFPDFVNFVERLDEARTSIVKSRGNRADRNAIYTAISSGDFPGLVQDYKALRRSRTVMEIILGRKKLGVWVGIMWGAIIAIPGYVLGWYFWQYPKPAPSPTPAHIEAPAVIPKLPHPPPASGNDVSIANVSIAPVNGTANSN